MTYPSDLRGNDRLGEFEYRQLCQIAACIDYAREHEEAGLPGHGLMLLVAKLYDLLIEVQYQNKYPNWKQEWPTTAGFWWYYSDAIVYLQLWGAARIAEKTAAVEPPDSWFAPVEYPLGPKEMAK